MTTLRYGGLVRNLHYLAANVLLIAGFLHLTRVFFTGSYQGRYLNWVYGLGLLTLTLASNYTGYLLPWDQTSYWAIKVGSNLASYFPIIGPSIRRFLLGGQEIGTDTLIRSFALHVAFLPSLWVLFIALHLWRIRKAGGLAAFEEPDPERIASSPILFKAELAVGLLTLSFLLVLSFFIEAPSVGQGRSSASTQSGQSALVFCRYPGNGESFGLGRRHSGALIYRLVLSPLPCARSFKTTGRQMVCEGKADP